MEHDSRQISRRAFLAGTALAAATLPHMGCSDSTETQAEKEMTILDIVRSEEHSFPLGLAYLCGDNQEELSRVVTHIESLPEQEAGVMKAAIAAYGAFILLASIAEGYEAGDKFMLRFLGGRDYNEALNELHQNFSQCRGPICDQLSDVAQFAKDVDDDQTLKIFDLVNRSGLEKLGSTAEALSHAIPEESDSFVKLLNERGIEGRLLGSVGLSLGDKVQNYRQALRKVLAEKDA